MYLYRKRRLNWVDLLVVVGLAGLLYGVLDFAQASRAPHQSIAIDLSPLALPRPRFARMVWIATLMPTGFVLMIMGKALSNELLDASVDFSYRFWSLTAGAYVLPVLASWATLSLVSGSLMYWNLRRRPVTGDGQVYARFD